MIALKDPSLLKDACLIGPRWVKAASGETSTIRNPADGSAVGEVPRLSGGEIEAAITEAQKAFLSWRELAAKDRSAVLRRWYDLIVANADDLAVIMTAEQGKPLMEARGEALYAASFIEWFSEEAKRTYGDVIPAPQNDKRFVVIKQPVGVCAAITPWNFPAAMITRKAGPALAAGCAMIVKPAGQTPLTALALAELALRAGVPAGVFQVVTGKAGTVGGVLTSSETVRKLSFTGSTEVGRELMAQCAPTVKRVSFELGGNAPFIVFDDADLDAAVEGAIASKYRNAGQTCVCANRLLVQDAVYDEFVKRLKAKVSSMKVGPGKEPGVMIGPLIDDKAADKVEELVADAVKKGAQPVLGGKRHALGGTFYEPTILTNAKPGMRLAKEEIFGPVAPVFRFSTEDEAISMANDTEYGLAAYFYTRDSARVWRVMEGLEYGMVGHNTGLISSEVAPFGGIKQSGLGREGSKYGIDEYLEIKFLATSTV